MHGAVTEAVNVGGVGPALSEWVIECENVLVFISLAKMAAVPLSILSTHSFTRTGSLPYSSIWLISSIGSLVKALATWFMVPAQSQRRARIQIDQVVSERMIGLRLASSRFSRAHCGRIEW